MKRLLSAILLLTFVTTSTGCQKYSLKEKSEKTSADTEISMPEITLDTAESYTEEYTEITTEPDTTNATESATEISTTAQVTTKIETTTITTTTISEIITDVEDISDNPENDYTNYTEIAYNLYNNGIEMYANVIFSCPYRLDYENIDLNGFAPISDSSVTSVEDIVSLYCTVFTEPDSYIYERYIEKDGMVYCNDTARGSNIYYSSTDLEFVSENGDTLTFNAISHYKDPDTGEAVEDEIAEFSIVNTENGYRISRFNYPQ